MGFHPTASGLSGSYRAVIVRPTGHSAKPASFRCAQAKGSPSRDGDTLVSLAHVDGAPLGITLSGGVPTDEAGAVSPIRIKVRE